MTDRDQPFTALRRSMWAPIRELVNAPRPMGGTVEQRLARLETEMALRDVLHRYTCCYDSDDLDGVSAVFHRDCTLVNPRGTYVGTMAIRENYHYLMSCHKFSFHHVSNVAVRWADEATDAALAAYFNCVIVFRTGAIAGGSGSYAASLVTESGEWKIMEMRITMNAREERKSAANTEGAAVICTEAPPAPPAPTRRESSCDWIGPDALS